MIDTTKKAWINEFFLLATNDNKDCNSLGETEVCTDKSNRGGFGIKYSIVSRCQ